MDKEFRVNVYRVVWENAHTGKILTSTELDVADHGDVIADHINVLSQFHSIFKAPPDCVRRIVRIDAVRQEKQRTAPPWATGESVEISPEDMKRCCEEGVAFAAEIKQRFNKMQGKGRID